MGRLAVNLSMIFTEVPLIERFALNFLMNWLFQIFKLNSNATTLAFA